MTKPEIQIIQMQRTNVKQTKSKEKERKEILIGK